MTVTAVLEDTLRRHLYAAVEAVTPSPSGLSRIRAGIARAHKPRTCPRREGNDMPDNKPLTVEVQPIALGIGDVLLTDPDHPGQDVNWLITAVGREGGVVIAEYVTDDGKEGRHGFEDPRVWLTVVPRLTDAPTPSADPVETAETSEEAA
ncbi:MAG: hypothetical protein JWO67_1560 [Streptosporangiaceae bacterium]|nr:hypothetical protein [Streptosporangiaceae bacterium]